MASLAIRSCWIYLKAVFFEARLDEWLSRRCLRV